MGGFADTASPELIGWLFWAMFAVVAGAGLAAAAATLLWRGRNSSEPDFEAGYNALAPILEQHA